MKNFTLVLTRKQIDKLVEITNHFKEVKRFKISTDSLSGIGPCIQVQFDLFDTDDTKIDITDVGSW